MEKRNCTHVKVPEENTAGNRRALWVYGPVCREASGGAETLEIGEKSSAGMYHMLKEDRESDLRPKKWRQSSSAMPSKVKIECPFHCTGRPADVEIRHSQCGGAGGQCAV